MHPIPGRSVFLAVYRVPCWLLVLVVALLGAIRPAGAEETAPASVEPVHFNRDIQPIFAKRCYSCHGPDDAEGGLRLDQRDGALAKLDSGSHAIVPNNADESVLLARVSSHDEGERMPPEGKPLSAREIDLVRRWIAEGATWQGHWAFEPVQTHPAPAVQDQSWVRDPIDAFILSKLEKNGLKPSPQADKTALLRRAYYDLTGLPPSPAEVEAFLADTSPDAYEKVVDQLLASPRYGERWGRHWLDLVRYADTNSFERDGVKPNAWRYRDYVIRSMNEDKPYDQLIREQLAGDNLPEPTTDSLIATGYYRLGQADDEPADREQARFDELDDIVATTSQVFLGLTVNCARCHDHKIDPIPQTDYYQMVAFFHEIDRYHSGNQTDITSPDLAARHQEWEAQKAAVRNRMTPIEQAGITRMVAEDQRRSEGPEREALLKEKLQAFLEPAQWEEYTKLQAELAAIESQQLPPRETTLGLKVLPEPPETFVLLRGNPHVPGDKVEPGVPEIFGVDDASLPKPTRGPNGSGRRLVLANWIASPDNMLTSRVMVNRIWQFHFGRGIVRSSNNFGNLGDMPTHPELLDYLATEFVNAGWRLKPLHRRIMLSNTYRMASTAREDGLAKDPENQLFWRYDMRRLSAEEVRDSIQAVNGSLNPSMYGPGYYPTISAEVLAGQSRPGEGWGNSPAEEQARRSIYIHIKRSLITPILADFDFPETDSSCAARFVTTQPAQALGMLNGQFLHEAATKLAERVAREAGDDPAEQLRLGLRLALCREPEAKDVEQLLTLRESLMREHGQDAQAAMKYACLVIFNLNEFIYLD